MTADEAKKHLRAFGEYRVAHQAAANARDQLLTKVLSEYKEKILLLVGPSRVGKTAVFKRVMARLLEHHRAEMEADLSFSPFIFMEAVTGLNGDFDWKDGFARLLEAGGEPLIGRKVSFHKLTLDGCNLTSTRGLVQSEFRRSFEAMVRNRRIKYLFVDEGSAILNAAVNRNQLRQFDILKSLCIKLGVIIIIGGAYDLAGYKDGNGQLVGRSESIHIKRYGLNPADLASFVQAARELLDQLPVTVDEHLLSDSSLVLIKSVGCVGHFSEWLYRASVAALMSKEGVLTEAIFEANALPNWMIVKLTEEAALGEEDMKDVEEAQIAALYGLPSIRALQLAAVEFSPKAKPTEKGAPKKKAKSKVGQRRPSRDPVGDMAATRT